MSGTERPEPGTRLVFQWRKWDGSPHWRHDGVYLGADRWGDWVAQPTGWQSRRPGREFTAPSPNVTLIPTEGTWTATCYGRAHPRHVRIYIDLAWDARWQLVDGAPVPTAIDMDLDVVRADDERGIFIDDRDEWDEHRVAMAYPAEIVAQLEALALDLEGRVAASTPPFDDATIDAWLRQVPDAAPREPDTPSA